MLGRIVIFLLFAYAGNRSSRNRMRYVIYSDGSLWIENLPPCNEKIFEVLGSISEAEIAKITKIDLSDRELTEIPSNIGNFKKLKTLNLNNNKIKTIEKDTLKGLTGLQKLDLNHNQLKTIKKDTFGELRSLQELNLSWNNLTKIESGAFKGLSSLSYLVLNYNWITTIESGAFDGLENVQKLDLSRNELTIIKDDLFGGLSKLKELDLSWSNLTKIESVAFRNPSNIWKLNLSNNSLSVLPDSIKNLTQLRLINLECNPNFLESIIEEDRLKNGELGKAELTKIFGGRVIFKIES